MSKKLTLEDCNKIALEKDGECLSSEYINSQTRMKWRCKKGHIFYNRLGNIKK